MFIKHAQTRTYIYFRSQGLKTTENRNTQLSGKLTKVNP